MKCQGIVVCLSKNKAVVTTDEFQCFYIRRSPTLYIGKEVEFTDKEIIRKKPIMKALMLSVACILILFFATSFSRLVDVFNALSEQKVFAYVSVDINPSLEIEINKVGSVLRVVPLNEDAEQLINGLNSRGIKLSQTIDSILKKLKESNVINEVGDNYILFSSTLNNNKNTSDKEYLNDKQKLDNIINSLEYDIEAKEKSKIKMYILKTDINERKKAQSAGVSTGRYVLFNKYKDFKNGLSIEEARSMDIDVLLKGVLSNEKQKDSLEEIVSSDLVTLAPTPVFTQASTPVSSKTPIPASTPYTTTPYTTTAVPTSISSTVVSTSIPVPTSTSTKIENSIFMRFESYNYPGQFIRHASFKLSIYGDIKPIEDSVFKVVPGLADPECISFESKNFPGYYLKHENFEVILKKDDGSENFKKDATFRKVPGLWDNNLFSFQSYNFSNRYIRHRKFNLYVEEIVTDLEKKDATYKEVKFE